MSTEDQAIANVNKTEEEINDGLEQADTVAISTENEKKSNQKTAEIVTTAKTQSLSDLKGDKKVRQSQESPLNEVIFKTINAAEYSNQTNEASSLNTAEPSEDAEASEESEPGVMGLDASDAEDDDSVYAVYYEESSEASLYERLRNEIIMASDDDTDAESLPEYEANEFFDWINERNEYRENTGRDI